MSGLRVYQGGNSVLSGDYAGDDRTGIPAWNCIVPAEFDLWYLLMAEVNAA